MYIPYLLEWTLWLQLLSGLERRGVYSRVATIICVCGGMYAHTKLPEGGEPSKRSYSMSTPLCVGTTSTRQCGLRTRLKRSLAMSCVSYCRRCNPQAKRMRCRMFSPFLPCWQPFSVLHVVSSHLQVSLLCPLAIKNVFPCSAHSRMPTTLLHSLPSVASLQVRPLKRVRCLFEQIQYMCFQHTSTT